MLWGDEDEEDAEEDLITEEMLEQVEHLDRDEFNVPEILNDTFSDLDQIVQFLDELQQVRAQARRQAQGPPEAAHDRSRPEEAQGAHLQRVRRHGPLPALRTGGRGHRRASSRSTAAARRIAAMSSGVSPRTTTGLPAPSLPKTARRKSAF